MSFWKSELGEVNGEQQNAFAGGSTPFTTIPDGTKALAKIKEFKNKEYMGGEYLEIQWVLTEGEFERRHVFHKIKVFDAEPKKRHRGLNMLLLIYKMFKQKPLDSDGPTDSQLKVFVGKCAGIKIQEFTSDQGRVSNWVSEVHPAAGFKGETGISEQVPPLAYSSGDLPKSDGISEREEFNDDIPF